jgi:hypothetical protein
MHLGAIPLRQRHHGGTLNISLGSMKRKFEEIMSINLMVSSNSNIEGRPPLAFYDSELPGGASTLKEGQH